MDFGSSFSFVFKDPDWFKKLAIMGLVTLIPVVGQLTLMGWMAEMIRRVAQGNLEPRLPDLEFGKQLGDGFKLFVVALVYSVPLLIIYLPFVIVMAIVGDSASSDAAVTAILVSSICVAIFAIVYGILMALVIPAAYGRTAVLGTISAGLKFGEVFKMVKENLSAYFIVFLGTLAASFIASLGSIACGIGILLTVPFSQAMMGHLIGQAYSKSAPGSGVTYAPPPAYNEPIPPAI